MALNLSPPVNRLSNGMIRGIRHTSVYCPWFPRPTTSTGCSNWLGLSGSRLQGSPCILVPLPIDCWQRWRVRRYTLRSLSESGGISGKPREDWVPWPLHRKSICHSHSFSIQRHYPLIAYVPDILNIRCRRVKLFFCILSRELFKSPGPKTESLKNVISLGYKFLCSRYWDMSVLLPSWVES